MLTFLAMLGGWEVWVILFVALLLFGSTRLPKMARSMGQSVNEFKKGLGDGKESKDGGAGGEEGTKQES